MILDWAGPHDLLSGFLDPGGLPEGQGVYLWVLEHKGQKLIHYVGYSDNIRQRQYDHVVRALGGGDWVMRFPIAERAENRYSYGEIKGSWNQAYARLKQYIAGVPAITEEILRYLRGVEVFYHLTSHARDVEYILQQRLIARYNGGHPSAALCFGISLQGSRRVDQQVSVTGHRLPQGIAIAGLADDEWNS
jgi:hypothetical protein